MKIDFNNVRRQAVWAFDRLTRKMNRNIDTKGNLEIAATEIQQDMDDLRNAVISIALSYDDNNPDFIDLSEDINNVAAFNLPDEEEET